MHAFLAMVFAVFLYAFFPVSVALSGKIGISGPVYLLALHLIGLVCVSSFLIVYQIGTKARIRFSDLRSIICDRKIIIKVSVSMFFNTLSNVLLFYSLVSGSKVGATIIYESWPVWFVLMTLIFRKGIGSFEVIQEKFFTVAFFAAAFLGLVTVASAGSGVGLNLFIIEMDQISGAIWLGVFAAISMALAGFFSTGTIRHISFLLSPNKEEEKKDVSINIFSALFGGVLFRSLSIVLACIYLLLYVNIYDHEIPYNMYDFGFSGLFGLVFAGFVVGTGGVLFHFANVSSKYSNINLCWYFVPFFAVMFMVAFFGADANLSDLFLGAMLILIANFGLSLNVDFSKSYKMMLCTVAVSAYITLKGVGEPSTNYYDALTVITSVYAILIAFAIQRQHETRTSIAKESLRLKYCLLRESSIDGAGKIDELMKCSDVNEQKNVLQNLSNLGSGSNEYNFISETILSLLSKKMPFGEIFVIWLLGLGSVSVALAASPDGDYLSRFVSVILSSSIVFLSFLILERNLNKIIFTFDGQSNPAGESKKSGWIRSEYNSEKYDHYISAGFVVLIFLMLYLAAFNA